MAHSCGARKHNHAHNNISFGLVFAILTCSKGDKASPVEHAARSCSDSRNSQRGARRCASGFGQAFDRQSSVEHAVKPILDGGNYSRSSKRLVDTEVHPIIKTRTRSEDEASTWGVLKTNLMTTNTQFHFTPFHRTRANPIDTDAGDTRRDGLVGDEHGRNVQRSMSDPRAP